MKEIYKEDVRGFYREIEGHKFRPIEFIDQKMICLNSEIVERRRRNRDMIEHRDNWKGWAGQGKREKVSWGAWYAGVIKDDRKKSL